MSKETTERRIRRAQTAKVALSYQLDDCCKDGEIHAMVVADRDGLPLAAAGDAYTCDEVAARIVLAGTKVSGFDGTVLGDGQRWDVEMKKIQLDGEELVICAIGGTSSERSRQIARGAAGAVRILAA